MSELVLVKEVRKVRGGYVVEARFPFGPEAGGYGKVICKTFEEAVELLKRCDISAVLSSTPLSAAALERWKALERVVEAAKVLYENLPALGLPDGTAALGEALAALDHGAEK